MSMMIILDILEYLFELIIRRDEITYIYIYSFVNKIHL